jgi:tetratricopeptide (TPR) repeat protein
MQRAYRLKRNTSTKKQWICNNIGQTESALKYLRQTMVIAPRNSKELFIMGNCLTQLRLHDEAAIRFEQAIRIDPELKDLLSKQG